MKNTLRLVIATIILAGTFAAAAAPVKTTSSFSGFPAPTCDTCAR